MSPRFGRDAHIHHVHRIRNLYAFRHVQEQSVGEKAVFKAANALSSIRSSRPK
jgi:hypothetical protein